MTTEEYVRDPRFQTVLVAFRSPGASRGSWVRGPEFQRFVEENNYFRDEALIAHHAHFDGLILAHHYGARPRMWIDTLSMARVIDGPNVRNGLDDLMQRHLGRPKGDYVKFARGKRLEDFTGEELRRYGEYSMNDCDGCVELAQKFLPLIPESELRLIDLTVRMFTEPVFRGNAAMLRGAAQAERDRKTKLLRRVSSICVHCAGSGQQADLVAGLVPCTKCAGLGVDKGPFSSNEKFAALLREQGVEPPLKESTTSGEDIYAFAKTDVGMQELLEHPEEEVRFLAETRIAVKSTILETRAERLAAMADRGPMPVYLAYARAHTLRWAGGDSVNWQNFSNENKFRPELAALKRSIEAPEGHKVVAADSSQIECKMTGYLAQETALLDAFRQKRDVYDEFASVIFKRQVRRKFVADDFVPGQLGKVSTLGLGFGMGWLKFSMELLKGMLGAPPIQFTGEYIEKLEIDPGRFCANPKRVEQVEQMVSRLPFNDRLVHCIVSDAIVRIYRARNTRVVAFWDLCDSMIEVMIQGGERFFGGPPGQECMAVEKERIWLPNGLCLKYPGLERDEWGQASYWNGRKRTKIYGGLLCENVVQCLSRIAVGEQMLVIADAGLPPRLMTHDEVVTVVPDNTADVALQFMLQTMETPPTWAPSIPLAAEGGIGQNYQELK